MYFLNDQVLIFIVQSQGKKKRCLEDQILADCQERLSPSADFGSQSPSLELSVVF